MGVLINLEENIRERWNKALVKGFETKALKTEDLPLFTLEVPKDKKFGDYATNIAMVLGKKEGKNPRELALLLIELFNSIEDKAYINKVEIAGPGFINMYLDESYLFDIVAEAVKAKSDHGHSSYLKGEKINLEFVSANPTGLLHMGNARGAAIGDTLANVLKAIGAEVTKEYYINDAGNQIENFGKSLDARYREELGEAEVEFPADGYHGEDIRDTVKGYIALNGDKLLKLNYEERVKALVEYSLEEKLEHIKTNLAKFGLVYDVWYKESTIHNSGAVEKTLEELKKKDFIYENEGALWLKTTALGEEKDEVMVRTNGHPTYFAADIAYHKDKFDRGFDTLINIWGADHHGHVARMKKAMEAMGYHGDRLEVILMQLVRLFKDGDILRMSKRTGTYVTLEELLEEVGVDAARYFFVMRNPDSHLDFDLDLAKSQSNDNPVYYIQYAHARICSIMRQLAEEKITEAAEADYALLTDPTELELIKKLGEYQEMIAAAAKERAVHRVAHYVHDLAGMFHSFYNQCRILGVEPEVQQARIKLVKAVGHTIKHALGILGVSAPERM